MMTPIVKQEYNIYKTGNPRAARKISGGGAGDENLRHRTASTRSVPGFQSNPVGQGPPRVCHNPRTAASTSALYIRQCRERHQGTVPQNVTPAGRPPAKTPKSALVTHNGPANLCSDRNNNAKSEKKSGNDTADDSRNNNHSKPNVVVKLFQKLRRSSSDCGAHAS